MTDIAIRRKHSLGLARAREVAWKWAEDAEEQFDMECAVEEGDDEDIVHFSRSGVKGTLCVRADGFELQAKLGFLLGAFKKTIETEIEKNLDTLLDLEAASPRAAKASGKTAARAAPAKAGAAGGRSPARKKS
jgi:putative polyhydroxyalkanoate system protein